VTVAAFVLGIIGTVLAAGSLGWQVWSFRLQGARPKLTPVVGIVTPGGMVAHDATHDARAGLAHAAAQLPPGPLVIGVKVVNAGRAPFHVAGWEVRADPGGPAMTSPDVLLGGTAVPYDILPGAHAYFITELQHVARFASIAARVEGRPPRIVATVSSGGRTHVSKPVAPAWLALDAP
jgi:hypothetical protein